MFNGIGRYQPPTARRNRTGGVDRFQVLGDRCSGTNFLHHLMLANFPMLSDTNELGWKHGFVDRRAMCADGLLTIIVRRHVLRWLPSVHATPFELSSEMEAMSFSDFIRSEWSPVWRLDTDGAKIEKPNLADMRPEDKRPFEDVFAMRSEKFRYFDETLTMDANTAFTRFEDVNMSPERWIADLASAFGLPQPARFASVDRYRGVARRPYRPRIFAKLSRRDFELISERVNHDVEAASGYHMRLMPYFDGLSLLDQRTRGGFMRYLKKGAHRGGGSRSKR